MDIIFGFSIRNWPRNTYFKKNKKKHDGQKNLQPCVIHRLYFLFQHDLHQSTNMYNDNGDDKE